MEAISIAKIVERQVRKALKVVEQRGESWEEKCLDPNVRLLARFKCAADN